MANNEIDNLKAAIQAELSEDAVDFDRIGELTEALVHTDQNSLRFSVDARHVHRLGFELVGKQETAISELIKNAYDADATNVTITFSDYENAGGAMVVQDDGHGMSEENIRQTWMRLSTDDKDLNPRSPRYGRSRAGKKGIGRFAVERLGEQLVLETEVVGAKQGLRVIFNWDELYQHGTALVRIPNKLERFDKPVERHGTCLRIERLRDRWTDKAFDRVWKSVLLLQSPFRAPKSIVKESGGRIVDPGFTVDINSQRGTDVAAKLSIEKSFLDHRLAVISCRVDRNSQAVYSIESKLLGLDDSEPDDSQKFDLIGELDFEVNYFIYSAKLISGISNNAALKIAKKYGGLRIYRDGFRVLPYGESYDDWLELGVDSGRRALLVPASNYNFYGHVDLSSAENVLLEETSSREGLIENEAYEQLQTLVRSCLEWGAMRVASARNRKTSSTEKDFVSKVRKPSKSTNDLLDLVGGSADGAGLGEDKAELVEALEHKKEEDQLYEEFVSRREAEHIRYEEMLRILASLGISISVFSHEVRGALTRVKASMTALDILRSGDSPDKKIVAALDASHHAIGGLFDLSQYIVDLMDQSKSRDKSPIALYAAIDGFVGHFKEYLDTKGVDFKIDIKPPGVRTEPMHPSEIDSVLFNFLTNSVKSMERANSSDRKILIEARRDGESAVIFFQDTGGGVSEDIAEKIFDPFFTTSHFSADAIAGPGSGLGLKIVHDIAAANGGAVSLVEPDQGFACKFRFSVPLLMTQRK